MEYPPDKYMMLDAADWHNVEISKQQSAISFDNNNILNLFQIVRRFDFFRYIVFNMYLNIVYIYKHSKCKVYLKKPNYLII